MLDPKTLRSQLDDVAANLAKRGYSLDVKSIQALEESRKKIQVECEALQQERNTRSKSIGKAKAQGEDIQPLLKEVDNLKQALSEKEAQLNDIQQQWDDIVLGIPNLVSDKVPQGGSEDDNVEVGRLVALGQR